MRAIRRFTVRTVLPEPISALAELASNLRWSWHPPTLELFASLSPEHRLIMSMSLFGGRAWIGGLGFWIDRLGFGRLGPRQPRALLILDMVKFGSPGLRNVSVNRW